MAGWRLCRVFFGVNGYVLSMCVACTCGSEATNKYFNEKMSLFTFWEHSIRCLMTQMNSQSVGSPWLAGTGVCNIWSILSVPLVVVYYQSASLLWFVIFACYR